MRAKVILFLLGLGFVFAIGRMAYVGLANLHVHRMSGADFVARRPGEAWVELTGCELDMGNAFGLQTRFLKVDKGAFVPVRPAGTSGPAPIVLKLDDDEPKKGVTAQPGDESVVTTSTTDPTRLLTVVATVNGMVESSLDADERVRRALDDSARRGEIRPDYVVLLAGRQPDRGETFIALLYIALGVLVVGLIIRSRRIQAARRAAGITPPPLPPEAPATHTAHS